MDKNKLLIIICLFIIGCCILVMIFINRKQAVAPTPIQKITSTGANVPPERDVFFEEESRLRKIVPHIGQDFNINYSYSQLKFIITLQKPFANSKLHALSWLKVNDFRLDLIEYSFVLE